MDATSSGTLAKLEGSLQEPVGITAEREVHLAQQKHLLHQVNQQVRQIVICFL
ncbi:hypothetical protein KIN20_028627 [Parelaphostrongylus tenuis]|uniref:Uncharacterized protein n=1 Tax=Parelaphostrongylus tenuis TaxID=148309 RepID=A0AAD5WEU9_PARTN|nr:hypothetical protein KIN20_028627 [Parelaphostrongylus tenuis]